MAFASALVALYVAFCLFALPPLLRLIYGPSVEQQVRTSFANALDRDFSVVVLGNSRPFCGIDPEEFSSPAYNFAHNNDSYNQMYHKLRWLLERDKVVKQLVLGIDYFQFSVFSDSRNYVYGPLLGESYLSDYPKAPSRLAQYREALNPARLRTLAREPINRHAMKPNGQFVRTGTASDRDTVVRDFSRNPIQIEYLKRILDLARSRGIEVFITMPPMREIERRQYSAEQMSDFSSFLQPFLGDSVHYLDFSNDPRFTTDDFVDFTHLDAEAAKRFTRLLQMQMTERSNGADGSQN